MLLYYGNYSFVIIQNAFYFLAVYLGVQELFRYHNRHNDVNQQAQQNGAAWRKQVLWADLLNALQVPWRSRLKPLLNAQNSAGGANVLPRQPTTSLARRVLCGVCSLICMYLDCHTYSAALLWIGRPFRRKSQLCSCSWRRPKAQRL